MDNTSQDSSHEIFLSTGNHIPEGSIPVKAVEIVVFLNQQGNESVGVRWQGTSNIVQELGMIEYAKQVILEERWAGTPED